KVLRARVETYIHSSLADFIFSVVLAKQPRHESVSLPGKVVFCAKQFIGVQKRSTFALINASKRATSTKSLPSSASLRP
ncbi:unnamed protein product, partial [Mycena citricolor]